MKNNLLLSLLLFLAWAILARWFYVCKIKHHCQPLTEQTSTKPIETVSSKATSSNYLNRSLALKEGDKDVLSGYHDFNFTNGSWEAPVDTNNTRFITNCANYFKLNPNKALNITGFYTKQEKDTTGVGFANLGEARALFLKNKLIASGAPANQINTSGSLVEAIASFYKTTASNISVAEGIKKSGFTIKLEGESFASGLSKFNPTPSFIAEVDSLLKYQNDISSKNIVITGHTDATGVESANVKLGLGRADAVRFYLVNRGVKLPITADSKGSSMPIADNNTAEGKALNRRVEIVFN